MNSYYYCIIVYYIVKRGGKRVIRINKFWERECGLDFKVLSVKWLIVLSSLNNRKNKPC